MTPQIKRIGVLFFLMLLSCLPGEKLRNKSGSKTIDDYRLEVAFKVAANWAFKHDENAANQIDEALVRLTIERNGHFKDIMFV